MSALMAHHVEAYNVSRASENKIHDDAVARQFGFSGGLVPGAEVYAYRTHLPANDRPAARVTHTAIYRLRQATPAA